jgi:hypothetical protein
MQGRYFTLEQALALLPRLTELLTALQAARRALQAQEQSLTERFARRVRGNGHVHGGEELAQQQAELAAGVEALKDQVADIEALGCVLKDLDTGLVDFPALREGREVYLCWRLGEPTIAWWHDLDTGFAGRQPL